MSDAGTRITTLVVHHSAAWKRVAGVLVLPSVEEIEAAHLGKGWRTVGYHVVLDRAGRAHHFRKLGEKPAAQRGRNTGTFAVCLLSWCGPTSPDPLFEATPQQITALRGLVASIQALDPTVEIRGHRELALARYPTECPGFDAGVLFPRRA